jgi:hypothetical protein
MRRVLLALALALASVPGCSSSRKQAALASPSLLPLDPTQPQELAEWWSDGKHLLFLDPSGTYRLFEGTDRYHEPAERGRWWQQSYASLWLEPYERLGKRSSRVVIRKDGNGLALDVPAVGTLAPLGGPPAVIEDRLMGQWTGAPGELRLGQDLRYRLSPRAASGTVAALGGQQGVWTVEDDTLLLQPDSAGLSPTLIRIRQQDETIILELPSGSLTRSAGASPQSRS